AERCSAELLYFNLPSGLFLTMVRGATVASRHRLNAWETLPLGTRGAPLILYENGWTTGFTRSSANDAHDDVSGRVRGSGGERGPDRCRLRPRIGRRARHDRRWGHELGRQSDGGRR